MRSPFFIPDKIPIFGEEKCPPDNKNIYKLCQHRPRSFCIFFFCCASRALHFIPQVVACPAPSEQVDVCASFRKRKRLEVNLFAEKQISKKTEQKGKSEHIHFMQFQNAKCAEHKTKCKKSVLHCGLFSSVLALRLFYYCCICSH